MRFIVFLLVTLSYAFCEIKEVSVAYNVGNPPLKFQNEKGEADGMLIDIWKLWSKKTGVKVNFIEAPFKRTVEMVKNGEADIHAGLFFTKERDLFLDYSSSPIINIGYTIFYHRSIPPLKELKELKPFIIGVPEGYTAKYMKKNLPEGMYKTYKNFPELYKNAYKGEVKVFISPIMNYEYFLLKRNIENEWEHSKSTLYERNYFSAVKEGNGELLKVLNEGLSKISKKDIVKIYRKWIKKGVFSTLSTK